MKTEEEIIMELVDCESKRLTPPLLISELEMETRIDTLKWVLGKLD